MDPESAAGIAPFDRNICMGTHYPARSTLQASRVIKAQFLILYGIEARGTRERTWLGLTPRAEFLVHFDVRLVIVDDKLVYTQQLFNR